MSTYNDKTVAEWQQRIQTLMDELDAREPFSYDPEADQLYQQYRDQYQRAGKLAMEDTVGVASGLTGGYGSTYAETAGAAAYGQYLDKLNDILPELYDMRRGEYNSQTDLLFDRLSFAGEQAQAAQSAAQAEQASAMKAEDAAFDRCMEMFEAGIRPPEELLAQAGLSGQIADEFIRFFSDTGGSGGSGSGGSGSSNLGNGNLNAAQIKELQSWLGIPASGLYDQRTQQAAAAIFGTAGMSAIQAWIAYQKAIGAFGDSSGGGTGGPNYDMPW